MPHIHSLGSLASRILELNTVNALEKPQRAEYPPQLLGTVEKEAVLLETASGSLQPTRPLAGRLVMELFVRGMLDKAHIPTSKDGAYRFSNESKDLRTRHLANEIQTPSHVFDGHFMGTLILRSAALSNQLFMQWLGDNAVHVNRLDEYGFSLLATAAAFGNQPAIKALLAVSGVDPAQPCIDGWTPLQIAITGGEVELVTLLASAQDIKGEKLAEIMAQVTANQAHLTILISDNQHKSTRKGTLPDLITQIGTQGQIRRERLEELNSLDPANLQMTVEERERQISVIHTEFNDRRARLFGDLAALVRYGTPVNSRFYGKKDKTLLHQAATLDQPELISWLLLLGADLDKRDMADSSLQRYSQPRYDTALHYACTAGAEKTIVRLLQAGADINAMENRNHYTGADLLLRDDPGMLLKLWPDFVAANLHLQRSPDYKGTILDRAFAAAEPLADLLVTMLESGCKHDWGPRKAGNYLHQLGRFRHLNEAQLTRLVTALIEQKYALEEKDQSGRTPLLAACAANHPALVTVLLAQHAGAGALDAEESGLLHHAAGQPDIDCLKIALEQKELDPQQKNARGQTPIDIAILCGNQAATELLFTQIAGTSGMQGTNILRRSTLPDTLFSI